MFQLKLVLGPLYQTSCRNITFIQIRKLPLLNKLLYECESRADEWEREVLGRLSSCIDLVVEEAIYHTPCINKFRLNLQTENKRGRL